MLIGCFTNGGMFPVRMVLVQLSFYSDVLSEHLCLLFLHKSHPLTSILLLHQRMLHMPELNLTMTGRSFHCLCCLLARMSSCKILNLRHGTDGELSHLFVQISSPTSSSSTAGILLLRPIPSDTPFHSSSSQSTSVSSPVFPRRSLRLQSRNTSAQVQFSPTSSSATTDTLLLHNGTTTYQLRTRHCGQLPKTDAR